MHGLIANILVSAGRSIIGDMVSPTAQNQQAQNSEPFSKVLDKQSIKEASNLNELLAQNPNITDAELLKVSQDLKAEIVHSQIGTKGERAPISLGEWTFATHTDSSGNASVKITDFEGKSVEFTADSPMFKQVQFLQQIQEYLAHSAGIQPAI